MNTQPMYDYVMARLDARCITQREVAEGSGVPFSTLAKIAQRSTKAPSVHHVQALYDFFVQVSDGETAKAAR